MYNPIFLKKYFSRLSTLLFFMFFAKLTFAVGEIKNTPIDFTDLKKYALLSDAAYNTPEEIQKQLKSTNYRLSHYGNIADIEISYFLATNDIDKNQVISVRGTSNIENAFVDIALKLLLDKHTGIRLHNGFSLAAEKVYKAIQTKIKPGYTLSTTGHSLGGAVALILAMHLDTDKVKIDQVVTFGQPKVTNVAGANKFEHLKIIRLVTPRDLVPLVPPFDPVDLNNIDIYWHLGKEIVLLENKNYAVLEGVNSMLRATRFTQEALSEKNLHNHKMTLYIKLLNDKIPNAKQVPYKNNFNLFNLFGSRYQVIPSIKVVNEAAAATVRI